MYFVYSERLEQPKVFLKSVLELAIRKKIAVKFLGS